MSALIAAVPTRIYFSQGELPGWVIPVTIVVLGIAIVYQWMRRREAAAKTAREAEQIRRDREAASTGASAPDASQSAQGPTPPPTP